MTYIKENSLKLKSKNIHKKLNGILYYIYENCPLDYEKMKTQYKNVKGISNFDCVKHDPDIFFKSDTSNNSDTSDSSDGSDNEELDIYDRTRVSFEPSFKNNNSIDKKYIYKFKNKYDPAYEDNSEIRKLILEINEYLTSGKSIKKSAKKLKIRGIKKINIKNESGINNDVRGVRDVDWKLHFWDNYTVENENDITFHDLIFMAHKIKSHKFDTWYELYGDITFFKLKKYSEDYKEIEMIVRFYHGS